MGDSGSLSFAANLSSTVRLALLACALLPTGAQAETWSEYSARLAVEARAYAEKEGQYGLDKAKAATATVTGPLIALAEKAKVSVVEASKPKTLKCMAPACPQNSPNAEGVNFGVTVSEMVKIAEKLDCAALARAKGIAQSLAPYPQGLGEGINFSPDGGLKIKGCKTPATIGASAWQGLTSGPRCMANMGYGLVVDGAWGDVSFLLELGGLALREGSRGMLENVPLVGEDLVSRLFEDKRTHEQMGDDFACSMYKSVEKIRHFLATPQGREGLEIAMCTKKDQNFKLALQFQMYKKATQALINATPTLASSLAETNCDDILMATCDLGGAIAWELVSDTVYGTAATALGATGVGAGAGATLGVAAITKTLGKLAVKSADAAASLLKFLVTKFPGLLDVKKVFTTLASNIDPKVAKSVEVAFGLVKDEVKGALVSGNGNCKGDAAACAARD